MWKILFVVSTKQVILTSIEWSCFRGYPLNLGFDGASSSRNRVSSILVQNDNKNIFAEASDIQDAVELKLITIVRFVRHSCLYTLK